MISELLLTFNAQIRKLMHRKELGLGGIYGESGFNPYI